QLIRMGKLRGVLQMDRAHPVQHVDHGLEILFGTDDLNTPHLLEHGGIPYCIVTSFTILSTAAGILSLALSLMAPTFLEWASLLFSTPASIFAFSALKYIMAASLPS